MIHPAQIVTGLIATAFAVGAFLLLGGCSTLGISLQTDYGQFSYTLPELPKPTSSK
jgi:hypothetical protein